jgi:hypothetical protein
MAGVGGSNQTLVDLAKRQDPNGKIADIIEVLSMTNDHLTDMVFVQGNLPTGHRSTTRTSLPGVGWRRLNEGTSPTKSTTAQADEQCAMMEAWSQCDKKIADLSDDVGAYRISESAAFLEAMGQEHASTLWYGNAATAPEEFTGFAPRYNSLSGTNAQNIINMGGTGSDNSSIWLVCWGENSVHGIYPKGSTAGLMHEDKGVVTSEVSGTLIDVYRDKYTWDTGLVVRDWRYVVRIANIDISALTTESSAADLYRGLIKATHRLPAMNGKCAFYMNRTVHQFLDIQSRDAVQVGGGLTYENVGGKPVMSFRGIPLRRSDSLIETEAAVA